MGERITSPVLTEQELKRVELNRQLEDKRGELRDENYILIVNLSHISEIVKGLAQIQRALGLGGISQAEPYRALHIEWLEMVQQQGLDRQMTDDVWQSIYKSIERQYERLSTDEQPIAPIDEDLEPDELTRQLENRWVDLEEVSAVIVNTLKRRGETVVEITAIKQALQLDPYQPELFQKLRADLLDLAETLELDEVMVDDVWRAIHDSSVRQQRNDAAAPPLDAA